MLLNIISSLFIRPIIPFTKTHISRAISLNAAQLYPFIEDSTPIEFDKAIKFIRSYLIVSKDKRIFFRCVMNNVHKNGYIESVNGSFLPSFPIKQSKRILVITNNEEDQKLAIKNGAKYVESSTYLSDISSGKRELYDIDVIIANQACYKDVLIAAPVLRSLTPTSKKGNLTSDVQLALFRFLNTIEFFTKGSIIKFPLGNTSYSNDQILNNLHDALKAVTLSTPKHMFTEDKSVFKRVDLNISNHDIKCPVDPNAIESLISKVSEER